VLGSCSHVGNKRFLDTILVHAGILHTMKAGPCWDVLMFQLHIVANLQQVFMCLSLSNLAHMYDTLL